MKPTTVSLSFDVRIQDEAAFQRAKPFIAAANLKELDDYEHDHEFISDFFLSMDAYAQLMGDKLVAPLQIGIEIVGKDGSETPPLTTPAAVTAVSIEIPAVWNELVGTKVPAGAPTGPSILHDPQPHQNDYRMLEVQHDGITVQAVLWVDEFDDEYYFRYDVIGPDGDGPLARGGYPSIHKGEFTLAGSGLKVHVTPKLVPVAASAGYTFPELLKLANAQYMDGLLATLPLTADGKIDYPKLEPGLERYLGVELYESYDPDADKKQQIRTAIRALERTTEDIDAAVKGLDQAF